MLVEMDQADVPDAEQEIGASAWKGGLPLMAFLPNSTLKTG